MGEINHNIYLPKNIRRDNKLKPKCKMLYGELLYYCDNEGFYYKNYDLFSTLYSVNRTTIMEYFKTLEKNNYIKTINNKDFIVSKLKSLNLKGMGYGNKTCEWCGINTVITDKHHYPVPKREGGKKTVNLCPTCHMAYHGFPDTFKIIDTEDVAIVKSFYKGVMSIDYKG